MSYNWRICSFYEAAGKCRIGNRTWRWEFSNMFGPLFVDVRGVPLKDQQLSERHPVWRHFEEWLKKHRESQANHADCAPIDAGYVRPAVRG